jgi:hypothetical protein
MKIAADIFIQEALQTLQKRALERGLDDEERSMEKIVKAFNDLTGKGLTEKDGYLFMVLLKLARDQSSKISNPDDIIDGIAYIALMGEAIDFKSK